MRFLLILLSLLITRIDLVAQNLELQSILSYDREMSDIWGWSDGGKEYALVATTHYFSIVDVTDPENPVKLHQIDGPNGGPGSYWREMKTYGNYAYGVHDGANLGGQNHGLVIVDLSLLPDSVHSTYWRQDAEKTIPVLNRAHNIFIDEFGFAYIVGHNFDNGGVLILDLKDNPTDPKVVGRYSTQYVHDIYVRDNIMYTAEINVGDFAIIDASNKSNLTTLARQETPFTFTHNVWLSEDSKTLFTTDERSNAPVAAYDISDYNDIEQLDTYKSGVNVIPHNVYVDNDFLVTSYYSDGVVILDGSQPGDLVKVGGYDTAPDFNGNGFHGCWGVYPYLPSGNLLASDIERGLFIFKPTYKRASFIKGVVKDASTNKFLFDATVSITKSNNISVATKSDGSFVKGYVDGGQASVVISKTGYNNYTTNFNLADEAVKELNVALFPIGYSHPDTTYISVGPDSSETVCIDNPYIVNSEGVNDCETNSLQFGSYQLENNCITYTSNSTSGEDIFCFTEEDLSTGANYTNYIAVNSTAPITSTQNNAFATGAFQLINASASTLLLLRNQIEIRAPLTLNIFNMNGQLMQTNQVDGSLAQHEISMQQLSKGIYMLEVSSAEGRLGSSKFIKP